jgi:hypothetical protein
MLGNRIAGRRIAAGYRRHSIHPHPVARRATAWSAALVVVAATVQEVGAAFAVGLFGALGVTGTVFARFAVAGVVLCGFGRPRWRGLTARAYRTIVALALTLTAMNVFFYQALSRIPLGVAVTVEICGPLLLSVALSRRWLSWTWAALAFAGVALLGLGPGHLRAPCGRVGLRGRCSGQLGGLHLGDSACRHHIPQPRCSRVGDRNRWPIHGAIRNGLDRSARRAEMERYRTGDRRRTDVFGHPVLT